MNDVLKKPVHVAILRESHIQQLAREGKLRDQQFSLDSPEKQTLPTVEAKPRLTFNAPRTGPDIVKQMRLRTHLRVVHDRIPPLPADKQPPCGSCKTAACCRAYVVHITKEEFESGLYGDAAIEITDEVRRQLPRTSPNFLHVAVQMPNIAFDNTNRYFLEGVIGTACKFLGSDNRCTIYDIRPITCRQYSCVDDSRITQEMRDGTVNIQDAVIDRMLTRRVESQD